MSDTGKYNKDLGILRIYMEYCEGGDLDNYMENLNM
jgi:hypothetical protein